MLLLSEAAGIGHDRLSWMRKWKVNARSLSVPRKHCKARDYQYKS